MRTHHTLARLGIGRVSCAVLVSTLIACAGGDGAGPTSPPTPVVPAPLPPSLAAVSVVDPDLPVYLIPYARRVPYRSLTTQQRQWVDQGLAVLAAQNQNAGNPTGCESNWTAPFWWRVSCSANGYTCTITHGLDGHTTSCHPSPPL